MIAYFEKITLEALAKVEQELTPEQKKVFDEKVAELSAMVNMSSYDCLLVFQDGVKKGLLAAQLEKVT